MRAGDNVRDELSLDWIGNRRLQHANDRRRAPALVAPKTDYLSYHATVGLQGVHPEPVGQHSSSGCIRTIVTRREQASQHRAKPHNFKIVAVHNSGADLAWIAQPDNREVELRKSAEFLDAFQPGIQILDLWHGERCIVGANTRGALAHVQQAVFVAIGKRSQQHAAHHAENGGVSADSKSQRNCYRDPQGASSGQGTYRDFQITQEWHLSPPTKRSESAILKFSCRQTPVQGRKCGTKYTYRP